MCQTPLDISSRRLESKNLSLISRNDISKRVEQGELLVIYHDYVLNLTKFIKSHPGGELAIKHMAGKDATDAILAFHPDSVMEKNVPFYAIGKLPENEKYNNPVSLSWRQLLTDLKEKGYYKTNPWFWKREVLKFLCLWFAMVTLAVKAGDNLFLHLLSALCGATLWHQASFMAHDTGHNGVTGIKYKDELIGIGLANFLGGLSIGWWKKNHYVHHIVTNSPEHDPDIQHMPFFAVSTKFLQNLYSTYYNRVMEFDWAAKIFIPLQHYLFYIVMCFGRFNLYAMSFIHLHDPKANNRELEIAGMIFFWTWYSWMLSHLPSWPVIFLYIFISHAATLFLHVQITISHFGMPTDDVPDEDFASKALRTSMDVECPIWMDWFHGGLQFQVIHHLFPRVPRHNLRSIKPLVQDFAKRNGLTYYSYGFVKSNKVVLGALYEVAQQVKFLGKAVDAKVTEALKPHSE